MDLITRVLIVFKRLNFPSLFIIFNYSVWTNRHSNNLRFTKWREIFYEIDFLCFVRFVQGLGSRWNTRKKPCSTVSTIWWPPVVSKINKSCCWNRRTVGRYIEKYLWQMFSGNKFNLNSKQNSSFARLFHILFHQVLNWVRTTSH